MIKVIRNLYITYSLINNLCMEALKQEYKILCPNLFLIDCDEDHTFPFCYLDSAVLNKEADELAKKEFLERYISATHLNSY